MGGGVLVLLESLWIVDWISDVIDRTVALGLDKGKALARLSYTL